MGDTLDPHASTLLGRYLLGDASPEVLEGLRSARGTSPVLGEAMALLESTDPVYGSSPFGDKGDEDMQDLPLPDYLEAERLARAYSPDSVNVKPLVRSSLIFIFIGIQSIILGEGTLALVVGLGCAIGAPLLAAYLILVSPGQMRKKAKAIAEGGEDWMSAVSGFRRLERISFGPWHRVFIVLGLVLALVGWGGILASVFRPGVSWSMWSVALAGTGAGMVSAMFAYRGIVNRIRRNK